MLPRYWSLFALTWCRNFPTLPQRRNHYDAQYPTTDQHNRPCFLGIGPFQHFHSVGTSPLLFLESLWCLTPNNGSAQSSMLPWYRTLSTLPWCRNFSTLPQRRNHSSGVLFRYPLSLTNLILRLTSGGAVRLTTPQSPSS